jgi:Cys-tRNA(Pro) deacylase
MKNQHPATQKVIAAAAELGLEIAITTYAESTRTAPEAATAIGCSVAQIVKSLCFTVDGKPVMALVSGANMLDTKKLAALHNVGKKKVKRAGAEVVKTATGYSIGGVPPFGHTTPLPIFIDADLTQFDTVWAAAGTPFTVFPISPEKLIDVSGGTAVALKLENN